MSTRRSPVTLASALLALLALPALGSVAGASTAQAQSPSPAPDPAAATEPDARPELAPGDRVRIETTTHGRVVGTLEGRSDDGLLVRDGVGERFLPDSTVERIETSLGRGGSAGTGALVGGGIGAALGLAGGLSLQGDGWFEFGTGEVLALTAVSGAVGAGVGALVGLTVRREEWVPVRRGGARLTIVPAAGTIAVRLGIGGGASP